MALYSSANKISAMSRFILVLCSAAVAACSLGSPSAGAEVTTNDDLRLLTGNTPRLRLHQSGGGFPAYVWDVAGNEANFFIRDISGGSSLPFRIFPGAPTSSLTLREGRVGVGTPSPDATLELVDRGSTGSSIRLSSPGAGPEPTGTGLVATLAAADGGLNFTAQPSGLTTLTLSPEGDLALAGTLNQPAGATDLAEVQPVNGEQTLAGLASLKLVSYRLAGGSSARHIGPDGASFRAAFGLGSSAETVAPSDLAGVALVGAQALTAKVAALEARIGSMQPASTAAAAGSRLRKRISSLSRRLAKQSKQIRRSKKRTKRLSKRVRRLQRAVR